MFKSSFVFLTDMDNIHQEQPSIRNMQVVSSNRVHSTQSSECWGGLGRAIMGKTEITTS